MAALPRKLEMVRSVGNAEHHAVKSIVVHKGSQHHQTNAFSVEPDYFVEVIRRSRNA
jgi:hypothetical protein